MKQMILAATALTFLAGPALADDARTPPPPPQTPYYAPQTVNCDVSGLTVYFKPGTAELTAYARDVIRETREQLSGCSVIELDALSVAGDADNDSAKLALAEARRVAVMDALRAHGIRSASTAFSTSVSAEEEKNVMARKVAVELKAEPAMVG